MTAKQKGLGRGLDSLISSNTKIYDQSPNNMQRNVSEVFTDDIVTSPWQPRNIFDKDALEELVLSVKEHGVLQPLVVRKVNDKYELIAGERRWRAAKMAKIKSIPAYVINVKNSSEMMQVALIENIQREDLNAIEEAEG